jgi:FMN phosphatase YigB (HAD superfamily)
MNGESLRNATVFGDICKALGKPELISDKVKKNRILKEKYGSYPKLQEGHRDEVYGFVLDNNLEAIKLYGQKEEGLMTTGEGIEGALAYLQGEGIELHVVSEMKKSLDPLGKDVISRFLRRQGLDKYFTGLITPVGKIDLITNTVDSRYVGSTKEEGTIYDVIAEELNEGGIETHEAVMLGDRPSTDINPAHESGFKTMQYTGFTDLGESKADAVISSFKELKRMLRKKP